ncbi:MAG: class I SAM-dependent methyltransferase [Planctomycetaceae bacterium]|nr:class I SAM-dependent methyltransferase [Planctomycetaceae bacterium]
MEIANLIRRPTQRGYRTSHLSRGEDYHEMFEQNVRRRCLWRIEQQALSEIIQLCGPKETVRHLDFACGTGRILRHLERFVSRSVGIDVSASMLNIARRESPAATLLVGDLTVNPSLLSDQEFDLITAFRFFPNAEPELRTSSIRALANRLSPGGCLVFNNHRSTTSIRCRAARCVRGRADYGMSPQEVSSLTQDAGLVITRQFHTGVVPDTEEHPWRPRFLVDSIESIASRLPVGFLAEDVIYVCCREN